MREDADNRGREALVSVKTWCVLFFYFINENRIGLKMDSYMLQDQMNLICLLFEELPEISRQAEAVGNLAFNVSAHSVTTCSCSCASSESDIQHQQPTQAFGSSHHCVCPPASNSWNSWHQLF